MPTISHGGGRWKGSYSSNSSALSTTPENILGDYDRNQKKIKKKIEIKNGSVKSIDSIIENKNLYKSNNMNFKKEIKNYKNKDDFFKNNKPIIYETKTNKNSNFSRKRKKIDDLLNGKFLE